MLAQPRKLVKQLESKPNAVRFSLGAEPEPIITEPLANEATRPSHGTTSKPLHPSQYLAST